MFSEELERAREQREGSAPEAERRAERSDARRATRRASFGGETDEAPQRSSAEESHLPRAEELAPGVAPRIERAPERPLETSPVPGPTEGEGSASGTASAADDGPTNAAPRLLAAPTQPGALSGAALGALATAATERAPLPALALASAPAAEPAPLASTATRAPQVRAAGTSEGQAPAGHAALARAEEVLRQVELHLSGGVKRISIELTPDDLGRLSIQLALRGGKLAAIVRGERPETLELLRAREEDLKRMLAERGIAAEAVRFELGFKARPEARTAPMSSSPGHASRASGGPVSFDSYA